MHQTLILEFMKTIPDLGGKDSSSQIILIILEFRSFRIPLIGNPLTPLPPHCAGAN